MPALYDWLSSQHSGLKTFRAFQQRALDGAATDPDHRALYRLLAELAGDYVSRYEAEPVPVDFAEHSYQDLLEIAGAAEASMAMPANDQIQVLNRLAARTLI
jgi:hypothetical protein